MTALSLALPLVQYGVGHPRKAGQIAVDRVL